VARNPFKPTAGASPPLLVGRQAALEEFAESISDGPGAPGRLTIFTGARGVGKTVMLTEVADQAMALGWITFAETATPGLIGRLTHAATASLQQLDPRARSGRSLTGLTLPLIGGGLTLSPAAQTVVGWRSQVGSLLDVLESHDTGLLITIDEVHKQAREDMRDLATTFQHLVREDRNVALAMAGLPSAVSDLLNDDVLTFLRRATKEVLADVPLDDVRRALQETITTEGRTITTEALEEATEATGGYPFMIQLVGYHVWRKARDDVIDLVAVAAGIQAARKRLGSTVHETALGDLSAVDRTYLVAMSHDPGPSHTPTVAQRMGEDMSYAGVYRSRLIDAGIIEPVGRGYVDFTIPYLREYLREHADRYAVNSPTRRPRR
jgi:hypothetical protein